MHTLRRYLKNEMIYSIHVTSNHENQDNQEDNTYDYFLQSSVCMRCLSTNHPKLQATSCQLVFGGDMIDKFGDNWD
jgi:hypothetical protein